MPSEKEETPNVSYLDEAVEAARSFNWEGAPLKRNLIEEVLFAAEPFIAKHYEEKARKEVEARLLGDEAVEAAAGAHEKRCEQLHAPTHTESAKLILSAALASQETKEAPSDV